MDGAEHLLWVIPAGLLLADVVFSSLGVEFAPTVRRRHLIFVVVATAMVVVGGLGGVWIFAFFVAGNLTLGRQEFVPFSTYSMFSFPSKRLRTVVVAYPGTADRKLDLPFGIPPPDITKLFRTFLDAQADDLDDEEALEQTGREMMAEFERRRLQRSPAPPAVDYDIVELWHEVRNGEVRADWKCIGQSRVEEGSFE